MDVGLGGLVLQVAQPRGPRFQTDLSNDVVLSCQDDGKTIAARARVTEIPPQSKAKFWRSFKGNRNRATSLRVLRESPRGHPPMTGPLEWGVGR